MFTALSKNNINQNLTRNIRYVHFDIRKVKINHYLIFDRLLLITPLFILFMVLKIRKIDHFIFQQ